MAAAGLSDGHIRNTHAVVIEFARSTMRPLWGATFDDADRFLAEQRRLGRSVSTRAGKAGTCALFYEFVITRYQGQIHRGTGVVVEQPIDEFNRQSGASLGKVRVPPSDAEIDAPFTGWCLSIPRARKYLPAERDSFAASLWRRLGLRINETARLDVRDWHAGGEPTTPQRSATTAAAPSRSATRAPGGCAWSKRGSARNPARRPTCRSRNGQQLFLTNMMFQRPKTPRLTPKSRAATEPWRRKHKPPH